jgi:hypothetical protein
MGQMFTICIYEKQVTMFTKLYMTRTRKKGFNFSPGSVENLIFGAHFFKFNSTKDNNTSKILSLFYYFNIGALCYALKKRSFIFKVSELNIYISPCQSCCNFVH